MFEGAGGGAPSVSLWCLHALFTRRIRGAEQPLLTTARPSAIAGVVAERDDSSSPKPV